MAMKKPTKGGGLLRPVIALLLLMKPHSHFLVTPTSVIVLCGETVCKVNETTYETFLMKHWITTPFEIRPGLLCCNFTGSGKIAGQWLIDNGIKKEVKYTQLELDLLVEYKPTEEEKEEGTS